MISRQAILTGAALALATAASSARAQPTDGRPSGARVLTLEQAVALAVDHNPDALTSRAEVNAAEATRNAARGAFGPKLHADANAQQWNGPYNLFFAGMPFTVRDAFTWTADAMVEQPLTSLIGIYEQYKVGDIGVDVATLREAESRRTVALGAIRAYYSLLEAERLSQVADASVAQLEAQQRQAQSLFDNGVIGKNDLLRSALALAGARQRAIQAHGQVDVAHGELAVAMGLSDADAFEPIAFTGEPPALRESTVESAEAQASAQRLELRELDRRIAQSEHGVAYARSKFVPQVNAVGNYTHTEGSPFQPVDSAFAGVVASWDVWDWGTTKAGVTGAEARLNQAQLARRKAADAVRLEARRAYVAAETAREALGVARAAVSQAEENYRIVSKRFENAAATSFDVVDAEALLTQARGQVESALYGFLIAQATLDEATGAPLPGLR